jgi:hypothetical protein
MDVKQILQLPHDQLLSYLEYLRTKNPYDRSDLETLLVRAVRLSIFKERHMKQVH